MTEREKIIVQYALMVAIFGENDPQTVAFGKQYDSKEYLAAFIEAVLRVRFLKETQSP